MMLFDTVDASGFRLTNDGYMVAEARVARTGIQLYTASELGMDGDPSRVVRVYRSPDEVFDTKAMASYAHRPITDDHPNEMIDSTNWQKLAKGQTGDEVLRDGEFVRVPLVLMDADAINKVGDGKRELSMGYTMDLEIVDGKTPDGEQYDAIQKNLRMNHLAIVSRARGGSKLKLGDDKPEDSDMDLKTIIVDGLSVETTEAGVQAISKLQQDIADANDNLASVQETHATAIAAKDTELASKDAEIETLKGKQLSDDDLDQLVKDRGDLIATAKTIADKDYTGLSDADIRKTAVVAVLGADKVADKSDEYITARFDILAEESAQDGVRRVIKSGDNQPANGVAEAHDKMVGDLGNAWRTKTEGA